MKQFLLSIPLSLCLIILSTTPGMAEVYRWTDDSGKVVFGDSPPKDKKATPVRIDNTENSGTQFATPGQTQAIERSAKQRKRAAPTQQTTTRIDAYCRRYISELNKAEIYLEHAHNQRDQNKVRDLRKLIDKECGSAVLNRKFDDSWCTRYRRKLSKTEIFLEHTSNPRDARKVENLKKQIARECN